MVDIGNVLVDIVKMFLFLYCCLYLKHCNKFSFFLSSESLLKLSESLLDQWNIVVFSSYYSVFNNTTLVFSFLNKDSIVLQLIMKIRGALAALVESDSSFISITLFVITQIVLIYSDYFLLHNLPTLNMCYLFFSWTVNYHFVVSE